MSGILWKCLGCGDEVPKESIPTYTHNGYEWFHHKTPCLRCGGAMVLCRKLETELVKTEKIESMSSRMAQDVLDGKWRTDTPVTEMTGVHSRLKAIEEDLAFQDWMKKVNMEIFDICGLSCDDLPDFLYRDLFDAGECHIQVAKDALVEAGCEVDEEEGEDE